MVSARFTRPYPLTRPPSWCKSLKEDLPILIPPVGPDSWQGFCEWHDYGADPQLHLSMYAFLKRSPGNGSWTDERLIDGVRFVMILTGTDPGSSWTIKLEVWRSPVHMESFTFDPFLITTEPIWATPHLTKTWPDSDDYVSAEASA